MSAENKPVVLTCPTCNAPLDFDGLHTLVRCKFCGNSSVVPTSLVNTQQISPAGLEEIRALVNRGDLQGAVRQFQSLFGADSEEANDAIQAINEGKLATLDLSGEHSSSELIEAMQQVQRLALGGDKVKAIKLYRETFDTSMSLAQEVIDQIANWNPQEPLPSFVQSTPPIPVQIVPNRKIGGWIALAVFVPLILIGLLIFFLTRGFHYNSLQKDLLIPSVDGKGQTIAAEFYDPNKETRFVGLIDVQKGKLLWKSEPLKEVMADLAANSDLLFVADGSTLTAHQKAEGVTAWQTQMSDTLAYGDSPMIVTGGRVVVITADQRLTAYDSAAGSEIWTRQLSAYDSTLRLMGDRLVVLDYLPGSYDLAMYFIDPISGTEEPLSPVCEINGQQYGLENDTGLVYDESEKALFLVFEAGCVERIRLSDRKADWQITDPNTFNYLYEGFTPLLTDMDLYFSNGADLVKVSKNGWEEKILVSNVDYRLIPLAASGDTLLVRAKRTRGTTRFELWGVNTRSGSILWQMNMQDAEPIDPPDEMAGLVDDTDHGWTWQLNEKGLTLLTFRGEPNQVSIETFDLANGSSLSKQVVKLSRIDGDFYSIPKVIGWHGSVAYLDIDTALFALDVNSGDLKLIY